MSNLFLRKMESGNRLIRNYFFKTLNKDNNLVVNSPVDMLQPISFSVGLVDIVVDKKVPLFDLKNILALIGIDFNYLSLNANDDCYILSAPRKPGSLRVGGGDLDWLKKHLGVDPRYKEAESETTEEGI